jgi:hypothetical protein
MSTEEIEKVEENPDEVFARTTAMILPELAQSAISYQRWHAQNVAGAVDMVSGLATANALALKKYIDRQLDIINDPVAALEGLDPEVAAAVVAAANDGFIKASDILRKLALDSIKGAETLQKIRTKAAGQKGGPQKPGFGKKSRAQPVAIQAQAGSTLNVSIPSESKNETE